MKNPIKKNFILLLFIFIPFQLQAETLLDKANTAFDSHKFKTALELYEQVLKKDKKSLNIIMWAAEAAGQVKEYKKQLSLLYSLVKLDPKGLKARQLLIKALEKMGETNKSKIEVKKLISLWSEKSDKKKKKEPYFVRDAFKVDIYNIVVFQYYALEGKWAKRYHFLTQKKKNDLPYTISFGSYPTLTEIEREFGSIGKNERVWHLDGYTGKMHFTYGFFDTELEYQKVKEMVIAQLKLDDFAKNSLSSSTFRGGLLP